MREHGLSRARLQPTKNWCRRLQPTGGGVVMVHVGKTGASLAILSIATISVLQRRLLLVHHAEELVARGAAASAARAPAFCQIHLRPVRRADVERSAC